MAQITLSTDDINGETLPDGTPTTRVTILVEDSRNEDSVAPFEIDLTDTNLKSLVKALNSAVSKYYAKGREVTRKSTGTTADADARKFAQDARAWAIATNLQPPVATQGAVPQRALDAYREHLANAEAEATQE